MTDRPAAPMQNFARAVAAIAAHQPKQKHRKPAQQPTQKQLQKRWRLTPNNPPK